MKIKEGLTLRELAGEQVVIPTGEDLNLNMMITLNDTGCTLWKVLEKGAEMSELVAALVQEYDVDEATASVHAAKFVENLKNHGFLQ